MVKKPSLGRGLDVLLSSAKVAPSNAVEETILKNLPVERIQPGVYQPRSHMDPDALQALADSIKAQGLVQPIVVRRLAVGGYEIIAGERRWRASQMAGLQTIPAVIRTIPDQAAAAMALIENLQREDLNALEQAQALKRLISEFGLTHQQLAEAIGRSRASVTNALRLLELTPEVKHMLEQHLLEMGHARALLALSQPSMQIATAQKVVERQLSVRETERLIKAMQEGKADKPAVKPSADVLKLQQQLGDQLGARVAIRHSPQGRGKLIIEYNSLDELDGILKHIQ